MRRVFKLGNRELWLATESANPEMRLYEIAPPGKTVRLRRRLLRRIRRALREFFRGARTRHSDR